MEYDNLTHSEYIQAFWEWHGRLHSDNPNPESIRVQRDKVYWIGDAGERMVHTKYLQDLWERGHIHTIPIRTKND